MQNHTILGLKCKFILKLSLLSILLVNYSCKKNETPTEFHDYVELTFSDASIGKESAVVLSLNSTVFADLNNDGNLEANEKLTPDEFNRINFIVKNKVIKFYGDFTVFNFDRSVIKVDIRQHPKLNYLGYSGPATIVADANNNLLGLTVNEGMMKTFNLKPFTKLKNLVMSNGVLSSIDLSPAVNLEYVDLSNNQLSGLNFSSNKKVYRLDCSLNNINEANMQALITSLPPGQFDKGSYTVVLGLHFPNRADKNVTTKAQVNLMKLKGWSVMYNEFTTDKGIIGKEYKGI